MDLYQAIRERRSIRKYKPEPVPKDVILKVLEAANWAPSGMNLQQWKFYVLSGGKRDPITASYGRLTEKNYPPAGERTEQQEAFLEWAKTYGGAPHIIVATMPRDENPRRSKMHLESVAAAFQNLLLAAHAEGLGTCWMTGPLGDEAAIREALKLAADEEIVALTPLGYPDELVPEKPRQDPELKEKVVWLE
ncbi:MAG: nitroreductase family protein [Firmicutes bacterium]|nr:nitroreductase family protein [Bacillota bacterium]